MDIISIILGGIAGAIASLGFAFVNSSPKTSFIYVPILGFTALVCRGICMALGVKVAFATFIAAFLVGLIGILFSRRGLCPAEVYCVPALLPMIPGKWAYRSLLALIDFMRVGEEAGLAYLPKIQSNALMTIFVMFALGVGVAIPIFLFGKKPINMEA